MQLVKNGKAHDWIFAYMGMMMQLMSDERCMSIADGGYY
jgi:hypothetical protein